MVWYRIVHSAVYGTMCRTVYDTVHGTVCGIIQYDMV